VLDLRVYKTRSFLYMLARLLGDYQAISSGRSDRIAKRIGRRIAGRTTGGAMRRFFRD